MFFPADVLPAELHVPPSTAELGYHNCTGAFLSHVFLFQTLTIARNEVLRDMFLRFASVVANTVAKLLHSKGSSAAVLAVTDNILGCISLRFFFSNLSISFYSTNSRFIVLIAACQTQASLVLIFSEFAFLCCSIVGTTILWFFVGDARQRVWTNLEQVVYSVHRYCNHVFRCMGHIIWLHPWAFQLYR